MSVDSAMEVLKDAAGESSVIAAKTPQSEDAKTLAAQDFRVVPIQELPEVPERTPAGFVRGPPQADLPDMAAYWKRKMCPHARYGYRNSSEPCQCEVITSLENCRADVHGGAGENALFVAFLKAYNEHQDILLAPDDIWLLVCLQFSKYVNNHSEELRHLLVEHEGQKKLTVTTWNETSETEWEEFLSLMKVEIAKNTKDGIVDTLQSNFSTSGLVERMVSTASIMDSFKKYFSYGRCIPCCGIRNACFLGSQEDWDNLILKTEKLRCYDVGGSWTRYIDGVQEILHKFIATFNNNVDVDWWNKVMNAERGRLGSGSTTYYTGWLLHLFGKYERCESSDLGNYSIDVPVKIDNKLTGELKTVHLVGGMAGVHAADVQGRKAFRPQTSMIVFHRPSSEADKAAAIEHFKG
jgi:hypothetical protein